MKQRQQKKKRNSIARGAVALLLIMTLCLQPENIPADVTYQMSNESLCLNKGASYRLTIVNAPANAKIKWRTSNKFAVSVKKGVIKALNYGTAVITARYKKKYYTCNVTVPDSGRTITANATAVSIVEGKTFQLTATSAKKVYFHSQNKHIARVNGSGLITGINPGTTKIILRTKRARRECVVTVTADVMNMMTSVNHENVNNPSQTAQTSAPVINTKNIVLLGSNAGENRLQYISFSGLSGDSVVQWTLPENTTLQTTVYRNKIALLGTVPENGIIQAQVDGKTYHVAYTVYNPTFHPFPSYIVKGKTAKINIEGLGLIQPVYTSRNKSIATVEADGTVLAKKSGVTYVDVRIGNYSFSYRVEVAAVGMRRIINRATYIVNNWKYSQRKRMKRKYYDCSSLVWKGYKKYRKYHRKLGSNSWALPAGSLFDYLNEKKQIVYYGYLGCDCLKPGDLIFYGDYDYAVKYSTPGRTLDIYHVAMYAGNGRVVEKGGQPIDYNNLDHVVGIGRVVN